MQVSTQIHTLCCLVAGVLAALLLFGALQTLDVHAHPESDTSSVALRAGVRPTSTYVSELAPAVAIGPAEHPTTLPATGLAPSAPSLWPRLAGFGLALAGCTLIYAALARRSDAAP